MSDATLEAVFQWNSQAKAVAEWSQANQIKRVAIADVSKNIYATGCACQLAKLEVAAVLENGAAFVGSKYRGAQVIADAEAGIHHFDGIVLSNVNPARVDLRAAELLARFTTPMLRLWEPKIIGDAGATARRNPVSFNPPPRPVPSPNKPAAA